MRSRTMSWTPRERLLLALCLAAMGFSMAAYLDLGGSAGAAPAGPDDRVTSSDIARGTIRSSDVGDGRLRARDLGIYTTFGFPQSVAGKPLFNEAFAVAQCNRRDRVISGGHIYGSQVLGVKVSQPTPDDHGWYVSVFNESQTSQFFSPVAVCMRD